MENPHLAPLCVPQTFRAHQTRPKQGAAYRFSFPPQGTEYDYKIEIS
jgi:hypothetical protein